jgi:hypothetical protein
MGYTHYWGREKPEIPQLLWGKFTTRLQPILDAHSDILTDVEVTGDRVFFNGVPAHETFVLDRTFASPYEGAPFGFAFCKTASKPYDKIVVAALVLLATITKGFPVGFHWSSDGGPSDHAEGIALAECGAGAVGAA